MFQRVPNAVPQAPGPHHSGKQSAFTPWRPLVCCLLLAVPPMALQANEDTNAASPLEEARELLDAGQHEDALAAIDAFLEDQGETAESKQPGAVTHAKLLKARCYRGLGRSTEAVDLLTDLAESDNPAVSARASEQLADLYVAEGEFDKAEAATEQAIATFAAARKTELKAAGSAQYFANRVDYDRAVTFARGRLAAVAGAQRDAGELSPAARTYSDLYLRYPEYPGARATALTAAALARDTRNFHQAFAWYLQALDTGNDRCFAPTAKLAENQAYLDDGVAKPPSEDTIRRALMAINECVDSSAPGCHLADSVLAHFQQGWYRAVQATYEPFGDVWLQEWTELADTYRDEPWTSLATWAAARGLLRRGRYSDALRLLQAQRGRRSQYFELEKILARAALKTASLWFWEQSVRARAQIALRRLDAAEATIERALDAHAVAAADHNTTPNTLLASRLRALLATCAELRGDFDTANVRYRIAAASSPWVWNRRRAQYGVKRVDTLRRRPAQFAATSHFDRGPSQAKHVVPLPDDRTTRGDWPLGYGFPSYVLCAHNYRFDRANSYGQRLSYDFSTTDPDEPGRLWVSASQDDDPAALWDPVKRAHVPANRDDYGEQHPIGEGPDLILDIHIPDGAHILSLYFVNDHRFYEPNRRYTISISDGDGVLRAIATVAHFGGGVYKRFAVSGALQLKVHIWRNLSLNTLLCGFFVDAIRSPAPQPLSADPPETARLRALASRYHALTNAMESQPVHTLAANTRIASLIEDLRSVLGTAMVQYTRPGELPPADTAAARWMLAECYRLSGRYRSSEKAFDAYLRDVAATHEGRAALEAHEHIARDLVARAGTGRSLHHAWFHRFDYPDGTHRWDRVWQRYFDRLQKLHEDAPGKLLAHLRGLMSVRLEDALPTYMASRIIEQRFPDELRDPETLRQFVSAHERMRRDEHALEVVTQLLENEPTFALKREATWQLVGLQFDTGAPPEDQLATYERVRDLFGEETGRTRSALKLAALAHVNADQHRAAIPLLRKYQNAYGESDYIQRLIDRSERQSSQ